MRRLALLILVLLWLGVWIVPAEAQSYSFRLIEEIVHAYWNADGTLSLDYTFDFANDPGAHPIDFVDVGLPNASYDFNSISAWVNNQPVEVTSDYQGEGCCGVAIDLGKYAIQPGKEGQVRVYVGRIRRVLSPDTSDQDYVSAVFSPTWFGSAFVKGTTKLVVVFHFPPGVTLTEPRYHFEQGGEPEVGTDAEGRVTYTWIYPAASGSSQYFFGASFPKRYVPASAYQPSLWEQFVAFLEWLISAGFTIFFCLVLPILVLVSIISGFRRKLDYMPPLVQVEGHGIKRGLTAVEAALLLEQPLEKVMTMILFSVVKKGAARVISSDPLEIEVLQPLPEGLHGYERQFLEAMQQKRADTRRKLLRQLIVDLIAGLREKMRGFSRKETIEYYRSIVQRAWSQVEAAETPEVKSQLFSEALEWTMLDPDYDDRARRVFTGPVHVPTWWSRYDPTYAAPASRGAPPSGRTTVPGSSFAASVIRSVQSVAANVLGNPKAFTESVTRITNPPPPPSSSGRMSGGGCACACAGCACACAGGGR